MAKNKPKGISTSKTNSIRELIREHHREESDIENSAENPGTEAVTNEPSQRQTARLLLHLRYLSRP